MAFDQYMVPKDEEEFNKVNRNPANLASLWQSIKTGASNAADFITRKPAQPPAPILVKKAKVQKPLEITPPPPGPRVFNPDIDTDYENDPSNNYQNIMQELAKEQGISSPADIENLGTKLSSSLYEPPKEAEKSVIDKLIDAQKEDKASAEIRALAEQDIARQTAGLQDIQDLMGAYGAKQPQLDLSPLLNYSDAWTGNKLSQGYKRPSGLNEDLSSMLGFQNALQNQKEDIAKKRIELLKTVNGDSMDPFKIMNADYRERSFTNKREKVISDEFGKTLADMQVNSAKMNNIYDAIKSQDPIKFQFALTSFAKAVMGESGVLTDQDIYRATPDTLRVRLASFLNKFSEQKLPPHEMNKMVEYLKIVQNNLKARYMNEAERVRNNLSAATSLQKDIPYINSVYGNQVNTINQALGGNYTTIPEKKKSSGSKIDPTKLWRSHVK